MQKTIIALVSVFLFVSLLAPVMAQGDSPFGRISTWAVERAAWADFEAFVLDKVGPVLDSKLNDGTLIDWGFTRRVLHTPEESHALWTVARSQSALLETDEAIDAALVNQGEGFVSVLGAVLSHSDVMVRSNPYRAHETLQDGGYLTETTLTVQPGQEQEFGQWWTKHIQPVYQGLFDDGTIVAYGVDEERYVTTPRSRAIWVIVADAGAMDKIDGAFRRYFEGRSADELAGIFRPVNEELVEPDSRRSSLYKVLRYHTKP